MTEIREVANQSPITWLEADGLKTPSKRISENLVQVFAQHDLIIKPNSPIFVSLSLGFELNQRGTVNVTLPQNLIDQRLSIQNNFFLTNTQDIKVLLFNHSAFNSLRIPEGTSLCFASFQ